MTSPPTRHQNMPLAYIVLDAYQVLLFGCVCNPLYYLRHLGCKVGDHEFSLALAHHSAAGSLSQLDACYNVLYSELRISLVSDLFLSQLTEIR